MISDKDRAAFEAGIKLGALYHQFVGTPVNMGTIESLENAIEQSISLQPYVEKVNVSISRKMVEEKINRFGYCELEGRMLAVNIAVRFGVIRVSAALKYDTINDYPLMYIVSMENV